MLWKLLLLTFLLALVFAWARTLSRPSKGPDRILYAGLAGGFVFIAALVAAQRYWAAGEGLIMLSPVLFIALVGTICCDPTATRYAKLVLGVYLAAQLGFGAYRARAAFASPHGAHYAWPYPLDAAHKELYSWDYESLRGAFCSCARTSIDIDDRYLESFVKMVAMDTGTRWSSARPIWGSDRMQQQVENPDCLISTQVSDIAAVGPTLVWLRRDRRTLEFCRGISGRLDAVPLVPWELQAQGLAPKSHGGLGRRGPTGTRAFVSPTIRVFRRKSLKSLSTPNTRPMQESQS